MAFDIGAILGKLVLDSSSWESAIKKAKDDAKSFEGAIMRNEQKIKKLGVTLGLVGTAVTALNVKMISMAASVEESENLFTVSMGSMASAARQWSKEFSDSLGLNEYEIRKIVGTLNVMLTSMGMSKDAAYGMSKSLVTLTQDMASFYNLSPEEAFQKIQSGITGEVEPLKRLGIIVNDTTVKQWALTHGIIKQGQELTEKQKIMARYAVIMSATSAAQGDLARTMDSTTNQSRRFTQNLSELGAKMGTTLLPLTNNILQAFNSVLDGITYIVDRFPTATQVVLVFGAVLGALLVPLGALLVTLPGVAAAATAMGTTVGAVLATTSTILLGIAAAAGAVYLVFTKWDWIKVYLSAFSSAINNMLSEALHALVRFIDSLEKLPGITSKTFQGMRDFLQKNAVGYKENADYMLKVTQELTDGIVQKTHDMKLEVGVGFKGLEDANKFTWENIAKDAGMALDKTKASAKSWLQELNENFNMFEEAGKRTFNALSDSLQTTFFNVLSGEITSLGELFVEFGRKILDVITNVMAQWLAMKIITGVASAFAPAISVGGQTISGVGSVYSGSLMGIPSFDTGADYVPYDMVAKVHKGEEIVPAHSGGRTIELTIQNHITPEVVAEAMRTREGEDVIVNIIDANSARGGTARRTIQRG